MLGSIQPFPGSRILIQHMLDRACIGYCFSYGNYEAASQQFYVRANEGNPYLMTYFGDTSDMEDGAYEVQPGRFAGLAGVSMHGQRRGFVHHPAARGTDE